MSTNPALSRREPLFLLALALIALVVSGIGPKDRLTWLLEVAPVLIGAPILVATARRFPMTPLLYRLLFVHALILILGAHYTYAEVPLGEWATALLSGEAATAFLGTQGDVWDTQWDMFFALCGALLAQALLSRLHDRQLARLPSR